MIAVNGTITNVISFDEGQVAVVIEEETVAAEAELQFTSLPVPSYPLTATNTLSNPAESRTLLRFQLEVLEGGAVVEEFTKPVRLVIDLRSLTADLNPVYDGNFFWLIRMKQTLLSG